MFNTKTKKINSTFLIMLFIYITVQTLLSMSAWNAGVQQMLVYSKSNQTHYYLKHVRTSKCFLSMFTLALKNTNAAYI